MITLNNGDNSRPYLTPLPRIRQEGENTLNNCNLTVFLNATK